jgi:hypothetical protein
MFKKNPVEKQMNIMDPYHSFPKYIKEALHKSWADYFYSYIFFWSGRILSCPSCSEQNTRKPYIQK